MRIGVTISRDWDDHEAIVDAIMEAIHGISAHKVTLIHGASQMDFFVAGVGFMLDMELEPYPADWGEFGKAAGMKRNRQMVAAGADLWIAWIKNESRGATDCANAARAAGIPVMVKTA
jgi:hypothetical protein